MISFITICVGNNDISQITVRANRNKSQGLYMEKVGNSKPRAASSYRLNILAIFIIYCGCTAHFFLLQSFRSESPELFRQCS